MCDCLSLENSDWTTACTVFVLATENKLYCHYVCYTSSSFALSYHTLLCSATVKDHALWPICACVDCMLSWQQCGGVPIIGWRGVPLWIDNGCDRENMDHGVRVEVISSS